MAARLKILLVAIAIAVTIAGCGGGDDDSADSSSSPSPSGAAEPGAASSVGAAEFASKASAVCRRKRQEIAKELGDYAIEYRKGHPDQRAAAAAFPSGLQTVGLPGLRELAGELRALGLPTDDDGRAVAYLDELEAAIASARQREQIDEAQFVLDFERSWELAREYGIGACAFGG